MDIKVFFTICFWHLGFMQTHGWIYGGKMRLWNCLMNYSFYCSYSLSSTIIHQLWQKKKLLLCLRRGMLSTSCEPVSHRNTLTHCKGHGTSCILLLLSKVDILYKLGGILIATYTIGGYVSIKATVYTNHLCVCVCVAALHRFHSLNTMYSLTLATIIWMIYGVSCH